MDPWLNDTRGQIGVLLGLGRRAFRAAASRFGHTACCRAFDIAVDGRNVLEARDGFAAEKRRAGNGTII